MSETPVTFRESSFAVFNIDENAVCTTQWGNLAIFSTRAVAEQWVAASSRNLKIVPVTIAPITEH